MDAIEARKKSDEINHIDIEKIMFMIFTDIGQAVAEGKYYIYVSDLSILAKQHLVENQYKMEDCTDPRENFTTWKVSW